MQEAHLFTMDAAHLGVVVFVLAMAFLSGVLGGYFFGMTHALRHGDGGEASKSIWPYDED